MTPSAVLQRSGHAAKANPVSTALNRLNYLVSNSLHPTSLWRVVYKPLALLNGWEVFLLWALVASSCVLTLSCWRSTGGWLPCIWSGTSTIAILLLEAADGCRGSDRWGSGTGCEIISPLNSSKPRAWIPRRTTSSAIIHMAYSALVPFVTSQRTLQEFSTCFQDWSPHCWHWLDSSVFHSSGSILWPQVGVEIGNPFPYVQKW